MKGVAVTATVLAVLTAIAAARGGACGAKTQLLTAVESSQWAYYQSKSIKQNLAETQKNIFECQLPGAANPEQKAAIEKKLAAAGQEASRYEAEKNQIRADAEKTGATNKLLGKKGGYFSSSVVFFQIAIMLASVSALLKKRYMWIAGIACGLVAAVLLGYGLFLPPLLF
jgi:hypothetical protein